jgi:hypothetical protein
MSPPITHSSCGKRLGFQPTRGLLAGLKRIKGWGSRAYRRNWLQRPNRMPLRWLRDTRNTLPAGRDAPGAQRP